MAVCAPTVVRAARGRVRLHVPGWDAAQRAELERAIVEIDGVRAARATPATGNVLVEFDPGLTDATSLVGALGDLPVRRPPSDRPPSREGPSGGDRGLSRLRVAVRGLDRDPGMARRLVARLSARPEVHRVSANAMTGRVLVEFSRRVTDLQGVLAEVSDIELPDAPGDVPAHPLDPAPLIQSSARAVGAGLGLALLAARRAAGRSGPPVGGAAPAVAAAAVGIVDGLPPVREGLREVLGRDAADVAIGGASIVALSLSGGPLGLAVAGAGAVRLWTEVRARRTAWRRYEARVGGAAAVPGARVRLEIGDRLPLAGRVVEGAGVGVGPDGLPVAVAGGARMGGGARLVGGGPVVVELEADRPFVAGSRPAPPRATALDRYLGLVGPGALAYAAGTLLATRSIARAFAALVLVNPRPALIGAEAADTGASARVLRAGVIVVGTRADRPVRTPDLLLVDSPRVLADGVEVGGSAPAPGVDGARLVARVSAVAQANDLPWGATGSAQEGDRANGASFDGVAAVAEVDGVRYRLAELDEDGGSREGASLRERGERVLVLHDEDADRTVGAVSLRPRLAPGVEQLVESCRRRGVALAVVEGGDRRAARALARRADVRLIVEADPVEVIRERQRAGDLVAFISDRAQSAPAFAACDIAVALTSGRSGPFPARADLLAPDLGAVAAIVEAGARRAGAVRASLLLSTLANAAGAILGGRGPVGIGRASSATYLAALGALAAGWGRLRGGRRSRGLVTRLADPRPERWGRQPVADVLARLDGRRTGLTTAQARARRVAAPARRAPNALVAAVVEQLRSPLTTVLAAGAGVSLLVGGGADAAMIAAVVAANAAVGAWQERQAGAAAAALGRLAAPTASVLRDGELVELPARELVAGDVIALGAGDRVPADARLLGGDGLEVDEAALTGESFPVAKSAEAATDAGRVVLEGSDVTVGRGRAVVVAVGERTRMGATAAALALEETRESPLGQRLHRMLRQGLPIIALGGAVVAGAGVLWGRAWPGQLALGASIAIAAVPEGLPLLAGVAQAAVARRLTTRAVLVRRLASVEALGRVDVVCADKTGTLTEGQLAVSLLADAGDREAELDDAPAGDLVDVLLAAALASPHADTPEAAAHPTDGAVVSAAHRAGLADRLGAPRSAESAFDPARPFHATVAGGGLYVKGAPEFVAQRCRTRDRAALLRRAEELSARGLRVLLVADGPPDGDIADPHGLRALGFLGISDPLRPAVPDAVERCRRAGIRPVMLTGDHPATARAVARQAGIASGDGDVLTGADIAGLDEDGLAAHLEHTAVVARITPLDKLRIVESLERRGHTVAMTGDGVNDAPALRLADVGVAMGAHGTEVARQAADVVLADDDFSSLVEALVEGRSLWRNIRRALGLLLGGNLGELGLMAGAAVVGLPAPLTPRQVLAVNLVTDVLPAVAIAVQVPEHHDLAALSREGDAALGRPLRAEVLRRGAATALPTLAAYAVVAGGGDPIRARSVAFAGIVTTQLAQTLQLGRARDTLTRPVVAAVAGSGALLLAAILSPPLQALLALTAPGATGTLALIAATAAAAVLGQPRGHPVEPAGGPRAAMGVALAG